MIVITCPECASRLSIPESVILKGIPTVCCPKCKKKFKAIINQQDISLNKKCQSSSEDADLHSHSNYTKESILKTKMIVIQCIECEAKLTIPESKILNGNLILTCPKCNKKITLMHNKQSLSNIISDQSNEEDTDSMDHLSEKVVTEKIITQNTTTPKKLKL